MKILFLLLFSLTLMAESWSVVYLSSELHVKGDDLKNIYLKKLTKRNGTNIVVLNLSYSHKARKAFMQNVLHVDFYDWDSYYDEMHFMGIKSPLVLESSEAMIKFLQKVDGSIGYIPTAMMDKKLIEITRFEF